MKEFNFLDRILGPLIQPPKDKKLSNQEIKDIYDTNINITLSELSKITGKSIKQLKTILMESK